MIARLARHPTAAPALTVLLLLAGALSVFTLRVQVLPELQLNVVTVTVAWPGAAGGDIDRLILTPLGSRLAALVGVVRTRSVADEDRGAITIEFQSSQAAERGWQEARRIVGAFDGLPGGVPPPTVARERFDEALGRVVLSGPLERVIAAANRLETSLRAAGLANVIVGGRPDPEISVHLNRAALTAVGLTPAEVADQVQAAHETGALGTSLGAVRTGLTSPQTRLTERELAALTIVGGSGDPVRLTRLATISPGVPPDAPRVMVDGVRGVEIVVRRPKTLSIRAAMQTLEETVAAFDAQGIAIKILEPADAVIKARLTSMAINAALGLVIVSAVLWLALGGAIAFATLVGILSAAAGTAVVMALTGETIDMVTTFAIAVVVGIVVDDALMVAERCAHHHRAGLSPQEAAERGAGDVWRTVSIASLTTVIAFAPLAFLPDFLGDFIRGLAIVVVAAVLASLVECFLIFPHRLAGALRRAPNNPVRDKVRARLQRGLSAIVAISIRERVLVLFTAVALLVGASSLVTSGRLGFVFFPNADWNVISFNFAFAAKTPPETIDAFADEIARAVDDISREFQGIVEGVVVRIGLPASFGSNEEAIASPAGINAPTEGGVSIYLVDGEVRTVTAADLAARLGAAIPQPASLVSFQTRAGQSGPPGADVEIEVRGGTPLSRARAAAALERALSPLEGVLAVTNTAPLMVPEVELFLSAEGARRGLTLGAIARQVRAAVDGVPVATFVRGGQSGRVVVRLAETDRSIAALSTLSIRVGDHLLPLRDLVDITIGADPGRIETVGTVPLVRVTADLNHEVAKPYAFSAALSEAVIPAIAREHGVDVTFAGRVDDEARTAQTFGLLAGGAVVLIAVVFVIALASVQLGLLVVSLLPFAAVGPIIAHYALGYDLSFLSVAGFIGLFGVLVNDTLLMVQGIGNRVASGDPAPIVGGIAERAPAVLLTSLTTFLGVSPFLIETTDQAQFLIPIALSLGFGLVALALLSFTVFPALASFVPAFAPPRPTDGPTP